MGEEGEREIEREVETDRQTERAREQDNATSTTQHKAWVEEGERERGKGGQA